MYEFLDKIDSDRITLEQYAEVPPCSFTASLLENSDPDSLPVLPFSGNLRLRYFD